MGRGPAPSSTGCWPRSPCPSAARWSPCGSSSAHSPGARARSLTVLFRDGLQARPPDALALALLLAISPFFFGQSFHVLTDNPTWFFVVLALERLFAYVQRPAMARLAAFAACLAAATLMRQ